MKWLNCFYHPAKFGRDIVYLVGLFILQVYKATGLGGYQLRLISKSELCFDTSEMENLGLLVAKKCDVTTKYQRFQFDYQFVKVNMSTE